MVHPYLLVELPVYERNQPQLLRISTSVPGLACGVRCGLRRAAQYHIAGQAFLVDAHGDDAEPVGLVGYEACDGESLAAYLPYGHPSGLAQGGIALRAFNAEHARGQRETPKQLHLACYIGGGGADVLGNAHFLELSNLDKDFRSGPCRS